MVKHTVEKTIWKKENHTILGYVGQNPNAYTSAMESVRVVVFEKEGNENDCGVDIRNWVESEKYTGPSRNGGVRLQRHNIIEFLAMLPEIKETLEISDEEIQDEIEAREAALNPKTKPGY